MKATFVAFFAVILMGCSNMKNYEPFSGGGGSGSGGGAFSASLTVEDDAPVVPSGRVNLTIDGNHIHEMRFRDFGGLWTPWEPYAPARTWNLPRGSGLRTVEAEFRDSEGVVIVDSDDVYLMEQVFASDGAPEDHFGTDIDLSDDGLTLVVGMPGDNGNDSGFFNDRGAAYAYVWNGTIWEESRLTGPDCLAGDHFGYSVAISGDGEIIVVGARDHEVDFPGQGAVYVFIRNASDGWDYYEKYSAPAGAEDDSLGYSAAISSDGSVIAAGAPYRNGGRGSVFVLRGDPDTGWNVDTELTASDAEDGDLFGFDVSLSGDGTGLAVGAPHKGVVFTPRIGSVYYFSDSGPAWTETILPCAAGTGDDLFGYALSLSPDGTTLAIGARGHEAAGNMRQGTAFVYRNVGGTWDLYELPFTDGQAADYFGTSIAVSNNGEFVLVGVPHDDVVEIDQGSARLYRWDGGSSGYLPERTLTVYEALFEDRFGRSVSLTPEGNFMAVGSRERDISADNDGAVFLFSN